MITWGTILADADAAHEMEGAGLRALEIAAAL
jgi:hypothetical protein